MSEPDAVSAQGPSSGPDDAGLQPDDAVPAPDDVVRAPNESAPAPQPRVVRRRDPSEMSADERAFLARHRADMPPHHDSAWG